MTPQIVEEGIEEPQKVGPSNTKNALMGGFLAAALVIGVCVIRVLLNDTLKTDEDVERYIGLPVLCEIPDDVSGKQQKKKHRRKGK